MYVIKSWKMLTKVRTGKWGILRFNKFSSLVQNKNTRYKIVLRNVYGQCLIYRTELFDSYQRLIFYMEFYLNVYYCLFSNLPSIVKK